MLHSKPGMPRDEIEKRWLESFGGYPDFDPSSGKISKRVALEPAVLRLATMVIVKYHYLHRGRTMGQVAYWITMDGVRVGVLLFALPRVSKPINGLSPMQVLELARMWLHEDVQDCEVVDSRGKKHSCSVASTAIGAALRRVREDWRSKYPNLPEILAVVSWADTDAHEGTVYRAANFRFDGNNQPKGHGKNRPDHADYQHVKARFFYPFTEPMPVAPPAASQQLSLFGRKSQHWLLV